MSCSIRYSSACGGVDWVALKAVLVADACSVRLECVIASRPQNASRA